MSYWWLAGSLHRRSGRVERDGRAVGLARAGVVLERLVMLDVVGLGQPGDGRDVLRSQPVAPLGLVTVRSKPPWNQPQVMFSCVQQVADVLAAHR